MTCSPPLAATPADCTAWNSADFFEKASSNDVVSCLSEGADPNARDEDGNRPLLWAVMSKPEVVKALLDAGADPNARDKDGRTSLHHAAMFKSLSAVESLLAADADPNARDEDGVTPLHVAVFSFEPLLPLLKEILQMQRSIDPVEVENVFNLIREDEDLAFFLRTAVTSIPEVVQALLDAGADPDARDEDGDTPLHMAATSTPEAVQALLDAGANPNARDEDGRTPLHSAGLFSRNPEVVQALLDAGADPKARSEAGLTPFELIPDDSPLKGAFTSNQKRFFR